MNLKFKKLFCVVLSVFLMCSLFAGCKIEHPNDVARDVLNKVYASAASISSEMDVSEESSLVSDMPQPENSVQQTTQKPIISQQQTASTDNYMGVDDVKGSTNISSKYNISSKSGNTTGTTGGWNHANDKENLEFVDENGDGRDDQTGLDQYLTDPIPEGKPHPVEPDDANINRDKIGYCTLEIRCDTILDNVDDLDPELLYLLDEDGIKDGVIYEKREVYFYEGESVFDVLLRETKAERIHMEFSFTPMYNSHYIEGINNFYEFSCGDLSGWMYKVNGWFPNYGCSRYSLQDGDNVEWCYTCDLGRDVGCEWMGGKA